MKLSKKQINALANGKLSVRNIRSHGQWVKQLVSGKADTQAYPGITNDPRPLSNEEIRACRNAGNDNDVANGYFKI